MDCLIRDISKWESLEFFEVSRVSHPYAEAHIGRHVASAQKPQGDRPSTVAFLVRVKKVLFQPFDDGRWFVIGFCAWLAYLGEGGGFPGVFDYGGHHGHGRQSIRDGLEQARD